MVEKKTKKSFILVFLGLFLSSFLVTQVSGEWDADIEYPSEIYQGEELKINITLSGLFDYETYITNFNIEITPNSHPSLTGEMTIPSGRNNIKIKGNPIQIPIDAEVRRETFAIYIGGLEKAREYVSFGFTKYITVEIKDFNEKIYNALDSDFLSEYNNATNNYEGPKAMSLVEQAYNDYELSITFMESTNWEQAILKINDAGNKLVDAKYEEVEYQRVKLESSPSPVPEQRGIPGFPSLAIAFGFILSLFMLKKIQS
jgi:hypothetical protein